MTDVLDRVHVWRPYTDPPLLTAAMAAGPSQVPQDDLDALTAYLGAVVAARPGPVHVNVAFNAAYFGYDLAAGGYVGGPLELDTFATVEHGSRTAALPVGAMVALATGGQRHYGEIVYREGAHPAVKEDGFVPPWVSGAPAAATDPASTSRHGAGGEAAGASSPVVRREKLVVDFDALTVGFSASPAQLARLRRQRRWLDERGHISVHADYAELSPDSSESEQYQRFLLSTARDQLMSATAPLPLSTVLAAAAGTGELADALAGMFATVAYALSQLPSVRLWGAYAFDRTTFAARLSSTAVLGGGDLDHIAGQLAGSVAPARSARRAAAAATAYTAVGPLLEQVSGATDQLHGVGYATVVAHANTVIGDFVRGESDPNTGLLTSGVDLRVDDTWQHGGVWRAQRPGLVRAGVDVTDPLGLGWLEATGQLEQDTQPTPEATQDPETEPEPDPEVGPEPLADPEDLADEGQVLSVTDSQVMWTQTLRLAHLVDSYLPIPAKVTNLWDSAVADGTELRLAVHHAGYELEPDEASQAVTALLSGSSWFLTGVSWPLAYFPALRLICTWQRGGRSVRVSSTLLDFPVTVDGDVIEHHYDPAVLTSDNVDPNPGTAGWQGRRPGGDVRSSGQPTWPARVLRVVRRAGLLDIDGRATLPESTAIALVCGQSADAADTTACREAVNDLVARGKLTRTVGGPDSRRYHVGSRPEAAEREPMLVYAPTVVVGPRRPSVPGVLQGLIRTRGIDPRMLSDVEVSAHMRLLPPGHQASQAKRDAYRQQRATFQLTGPADLPPGYTFVSSFHRSG